MIKKITQLIILCLISVSSYAVNVTFSVDMACYEGTEDLANGVFVNGTWNGWCGNCNPLMDNGDGTWSVTIDIPAGFNEFKFTVNGWADQEILTPGTACTLTSGEFTNRTITAAEGDVYSVAWNSCDGECAEPVEPVVPVDVTFIVDMSCYPGPASDLASGATVNGTFNGWCGDCNQLTDNGDGTWSTTISLDPGDYEFKFTIGAWEFQEDLTDGSNCTLTTVDGGSTFVNRTLTVGDAPLTISAGWNTCDADCSAALPMELIAFDVAKDGSSALLEWITRSDDSQNTFILEYSIDAVNFKEIGSVYGNDGSDRNEYSFKHYLVSNGQNYYRIKNLDGNESIQYSGVRNLDIKTATNIRITPTVSNSDINIQVDETHVNSVFYIYNILGKKVYEYNIIDTNFAIDIAGFPVGQYISVIRNGETQLTERFVKTY